MIKLVAVISERIMTWPVTLYGSATPQLPFLVFLARLYMTKFCLRAIWWSNVSKSRFVYVHSPPFLLQLDLFRELRQTDAYTCLRLVTRESEISPHDVILWPHPYSCHYSSRIGPHHLPRDKFAFICSNYLFATCLNDHLILVYSCESSLKRVGVHREKQRS